MVRHSDALATKTGDIWALANDRGQFFDVDRWRALNQVTETAVTGDESIAGASPDPVAYYEANVIRGPGAFVEVAAGYDNYAVAMKRKLLREIGNRLVSRVEP